jgi:alkylation response protein AidB-like acyl-CoA dehydrogenase
MFQTVCEGVWWGTITSEPGSGGDLARTQAIARPGPTDGVCRLTGQKAFGSESGITSYMFTTAIPEGGTAPYESVLRAVEADHDGRRNAVQGKIKCPSVSHRVSPR